MRRDAVLGVTYYTVQMGVVGGAWKEKKSRQTLLLHLCDWTFLLLYFSLMAVGLHENSHQHIAVSVFHCSESWTRLCKCYCPSSENSNKIILHVFLVSLINTTQRVSHNECIQPLHELACSLPKYIRHKLCVSSDVSIADIEAHTSWNAWLGITPQLLPSYIHRQTGSEDKEVDQVYYRCFLILAVTRHRPMTLVMLEMQCGFHLKWN